MKEQSSAPAKKKLRLGGMALENGLLLHGPKHWSAAIMNRGDEIEVACEPIPRFHLFDRVPLLRGLTRLAESIAILPMVKIKLPQAKFAFEGTSVISSGLASTTFAMRMRKRQIGLVGEILSSTVALVPALLTLRVGQVAQYHAVEHKVVAAYEQDVEDVDAAKEHERCGSHLVAPMVLTNIGASVTLRLISARTGRSPGPIGRSVASLLATGVAVEAFIWCDRHPKSSVTRLFRIPGFALQKFAGTREPTPEQMEVGRRALKALLESEQASAS